MSVKENPDRKKKKKKKIKTGVAEPQKSIYFFQLIVIVQSQCCFSICLYQFRGFCLLDGEIKIWGWVGQERGGLLTGGFFHVGTGIFFQVGGMSNFLAACPHPPSGTKNSG